MINVPWTIYRENIKPQYSNQWELIMFDDEAALQNTNLNSLSNRILSTDNNGIFNFLNGSLSIPQTRIKKFSFPTPFPDFAITPLPNKMNVYKECNYEKRDVSITFVEDTDFSVYKYFSKWFEDVYDSRLKQFKPEAETVYKYASVVFKKKGLFAGALIDKPSARFNLYKLKFKSFTGQLDLDFESSEPLEFTAEMTVENVEFDNF